MTAALAYLQIAAFLHEWAWAIAIGCSAVGALLVVVNVWALRAIKRGKEKK